MKLTAVPTFRTPYGVIVFEPVAGVPGYTHRIVVDGEKQPLWLQEGKRASRQAAVFFIRVSRALKEGLPKYHYADKNEDPPLPQKAP